jgi:hypothetical protein
MGRRDGTQDPPVFGRRLLEILFLELEYFGPAEVPFYGLVAGRSRRGRDLDRLLSPSRPKDPELFVEDKMPPARLVRRGIGD